MSLKNATPPEDRKYYTKIIDGQPINNIVEDEFDLMNYRNIAVHDSSLNYHLVDCSAMFNHDFENSLLPYERLAETTIELVDETWTLVENKTELTGEPLAEKQQFVEQQMTFERDAQVELAEDYESKETDPTKKETWQQFITAKENRKLTLAEQRRKFDVERARYNQEQAFYKFVVCFLTTM